MSEKLVDNPVHAIGENRQTCTGDHELLMFQREGNMSCSGKIQDYKSDL